MPFNGSGDCSVRKWASDFEDLMRSFKASEEEKFRFAKRLIEDTTKMYLRTIKANSWEELKALIIKRFDRLYSPLELLEKLRQRTKNKNETIDQYVIAMTDLAQNGDVSATDLIRLIRESLAIPQFILPC